MTRIVEVTLKQSFEIHRLMYSEHVYFTDAVRKVMELKPSENFKCLDFWVSGGDRIEISER